MDAKWSTARQLILDGEPHAAIARFESAITEWEKDRDSDDLVRVYRERAPDAPAFWNDFGVALFMVCSMSRAVVCFELAISMSCPSVWSDCPVCVEAAANLSQAHKAMRDKAKRGG